MNPRLIIFTALLLTGVSQMLTGVSQTAGAQDAETKKLLERTCTRCHTLVSAYRMRNTRERWAAIVDDMVSRGAEATDDEIEQIIDFLTAHYGTKVNVNKASAQELSKSLGISIMAAKSIVDYRTKKGAFGNIADLKAVPNVDWKAIESQKDRVEFLK
jgi:competence ComEA-like helix-hairpin-helix protein